jgi:hypothetical protein
MALAEAMGVSAKTEQQRSQKTPMAFTRYHFKKLKCYGISLPHPLFFELVVLLASLPEIREERCQKKKEGKTERNG